ncbi:hypothetical protein AGR9A_Cc130011 [Agrobacterium salinitolerans str. Hayward 0363]|nr:hypothetical protein AGR9A_Cc130011 [Agrobacterium salinitolerans str. Hayward 0363]
MPGRSLASLERGLYRSKCNVIT